jgi:triphosphoribosyl-dephospho-CoA synthase
MNNVIDGKRIAQLAQMACIWEACAPKPGNVNRAHDFSDTSLEDFLLSAVAVGSAFENADQTGIGHMVWQAVVETRRWVTINTNLGLVLLLAPLVKTCSSLIETADENPLSMDGIRIQLKHILSSLTVDDARHAYAAIRLANPGGLGRVSQADVADEPAIPLLKAMALAQDRDAIASEYVTGYAITFETGLPSIKEAFRQGGDFSKAVVQAFLTILKQIPDTLIARKRGLHAATQVSRQAGDILKIGGVFTMEGQAALAEMDRALRDESHTMNPGATADLTAAAIFLALLEQSLD